MSVTRREWIVGSMAAVVAPGVLASHLHALKMVQAIAAGQPVSFEYLDPSSAQAISALAAEIIPSDDGPGATEAGVVYFIDHALATFDADQRDGYKKGLAQVEAVRVQLFPASTSFDALTREQRQQVLRRIEKDEFFEVLRTHVVLGFLADPKYGGNRGQVGWKYIDFPDEMAYEPPFGYYDSPENKEAK